MNRPLELQICTYLNSFTLPWNIEYNDTVDWSAKGAVIPIPMHAAIFTFHFVTAEIASIFRIPGEYQACNLGLETADFIEVT